MLYGTMQKSYHYIMVALLIWFWGHDSAFCGTRVKVGVFQNKPMSFILDTGEVRGIYPDVIREIAAKEKWELVFVPDTWAGCLNLLDSGGIDLMISIARSREREQRYDFTQIPVLTAWGQVYSKTDNGISNVLDLEGKVIGVMARDINGQNFRNLAQSFKINCTYKSFLTYDDLCQAILETQVHAGVMNNITGAFFHKKYGLHPTGVLFTPIDAFFAAAKGKNPELVTTIDRHMAALKADKDSVYYTILAHWYGNIRTYRDFPVKWVIGGIFLVVGLAFFLFIWNRILGSRVRRHTADLKKSEEKYRTLSQKALVGIYQMTREGDLILANRRMCRIFGYESEKEFLETAENFRTLMADPGQFPSLISEINRTGAVKGKRMAFLSRDNHRIWGNLHIRRSDDTPPHPVYEGFFEDVSQRYRHEQLLRARLQLRRKSADLTVTQLLRLFLDEAEKLTRSSIGFFHFLSEDQEMIHFQTWSTSTLEKMCHMIPKESDCPVAHAGVWADCISTRTPVIHNDYQALPRRKGLPESHVHVIRQMLVPIIRENRITAVFGLGNKPSEYGETDLEAVRVLADTAWEIVLKKLAEQDLQASEARYRRFVETSIEGIWALDSAYAVTYANATMARMLGYTPDEMIGQNATDLTVSKEMQAHLNHMTTQARDSHRQYEARFVKKDGTALWAIVSATPLFTPDGTFDGAFAMLTDITARKAAEEELEHTQQIFLAILNGIESTIYVADMETHEVLFMNDYMKELFGADHTGEICWKALRHQDKPCRHCSNRFLVNGNNAPTGIHLWEDQHPVTGRWNIYHDRAIKWVDGRMARLQIASDVTRLKEMEHQQRDYENKIRQAQKMEALGVLASGIAHDFNNILFPILGYAELLGEEFSQESPHRKALDQILTGARRARDLVDQILTFSRQTEHKAAPLKPDLVIKEVIKLMRSTLPSTIRIEKYVAPDCKMIHADPTQIHQVAMNLVTNAFHAMEEKGGILTVRLENVLGQEHGLPGKRPYIRLTIGDTGPGMDPATVERIFDPYFTTKPKGKGTGLGLSVAHGIVQKYKGEIKIETAPGQGSRFDVFIPAVDKAGPRETGGYEPEQAGGDERILLVDDEPQVLKLEREILERLGYKIQIEASSKNALELIRSNPDFFDLVITDMTMPEMTGDLLTRNIREIAPGLPVIICTGFSERIDRKRAQRLGIKQVLMKPVNKSDLAKAARAALDGE